MTNNTPHSPPPHLDGSVKRAMLLNEMFPTVVSLDELLIRAHQDDSEAQCILGNCYQLGVGVEPNLSEAAKWYERSAMQGYGVASSNLAGMLMSGYDHVAPNRDAAHYWFAQARAQGFDAAPTSADG